MYQFILPFLFKFEECPDCCGRICKASTREQYSLTDKDIYGVHYTEARNPYYKYAPSMKLYRKRDIREIALKKYGSWTNMKERKLVKEQNSVKRKSDRIKRLSEQEDVLKKREEQRLTELASMTIEQRKTLISKKLRQYYLTWREDSKLLPEFVKRAHLTDGYVIALL